MELRIINGICALLLTIAIATDDIPEFSQKLVNDFIKDLKQYHAELLQQNCKHYENLYKSLLSDFQLTPTEEKRYKHRLKSIQELQAEIGDSVTVNIAKKVKEALPSLSEMNSLCMNMNVLINPIKQHTIERAIEDTSALQSQVLKVFQQKMYKRYHELFGTLPYEEIMAHEEYSILYETLERMSKISETEAASLKNVLDNGTVFAILANFFEVPEYKEIFKA